jgi:hypothetical protein
MALSGAPLGLSVPVECHGIFPVVRQQRQHRAIYDIWNPDGEWSNYCSAEEDITTCTVLLQRMLDNKWAQSFDAKEEFHEYLNTTDIILSKLALIAKVKPDGSTKHHLIWDFLRSKVNSRIHQGERVILPRVSDFVEGILLDANDTRQPSHNSPIWLFGIDISDAFHRIPFNDSYTVACINGKF